MKKKIILAILMAFSAFSAQAQLEVDSLGTVKIASGHRNKGWNKGDY